MRLDKLLAHSGYGSRKEVKEYIRKGYVMVNGEIVKNDDFKVDIENDEITIANQNVNYEEDIYLMLNKPDGYISATYDSNDPVVLDLIYGYESRNLFPVGRLDKDSVGLLLITNDGKLAHKLLSPKSHIYKVYEIEFIGEVKNHHFSDFKDGIILDDGYKCLPATLEVIAPQKALVTIKEGKFHQVKRMMESIGCEVTYLKRIKFGSLNLDNSLEEGTFRKLSLEEIEMLKSS